MAVVNLEITSSSSLSGTRIAVHSDETHDSSG